MYQQIQKRFAVMFTLLLVFMNISFIQPASSHAATVDQAVTITALDNNGEEVIKRAVVAIGDGDTAEDVLVKAAEEQKIALHLEDSSYGTSLNGIGNIEVPEDWSQFWAFIINGEEAPVGISDASVTHGDNLTFLFTSYPIDEVNVKVSINDDSGTSIVNEEAINLIKHATFYDALVQAASKNDLDLDVAVDAKNFININNIDGLATKANEFWELSVDDERLQVGALSYQIKENQHLIIQLTSFDDEVEEPETDENDTEIDDDIVDKEETETPEENDESNEQNNGELNKKVKDETSYLVNYYLTRDQEFTYYEEWIVWGLANAGVEIPASYIKNITAEVKENQGDFRTVTDLERVIIALSAMGENPRDVAGINLIEKLKKENTTNAINAAIFALIAFNQANEEIDSTLEETLINYILQESLPNGGWTYIGDVPSSDLTGMAFIALSPYQDNEEVKETIDVALTYLSNEQQSNGGFDEPFIGDTAESVAQVIIGLISLGIDPTGESFTKEANLVEHLLTFKNTDGLYRTNQNTENSNDMTTAQTLLAFSYYNDFNNQAIEEPKPTPKPESKPEDEHLKPESKPESKPEDEHLKPESKPENEHPKLETNPEKQTGERLPDTATPFYNILVVGLIVIIMGIIVFVIQRKKQK